MARKYKQFVLNNSQLNFYDKVKRPEDMRNNMIKGS